MRLCQDNSRDIAPHAADLATQVMKPEFVAQWKYKDCYCDIMSGLGSLIPHSAQLNVDGCAELIKLIIQPLLLPIG
jgi:hypothetical protein